VEVKVDILNSLKTFTESFPLVSIIIYSFIITLFLTWVYKKTTNQKRMKEIKERTAELRKETMKNKDKPEKVMELQKEIMQLSMEQMKASFRPVLFTIIPIYLIFTFLKKIYTGLNIPHGGNIIYWKADLPLVHDGAGWFLSYIIFGIIFNSIIRKIMKVH